MKLSVLLGCEQYIIFNISVYWRKTKHANNVIFLKVRLNEAENKYKDIQDKLEKISEETNARAPECMALKADVTAKKRAYHEAEVREIARSGILKTACQISILFVYF